MSFIAPEQTVTQMIGHAGATIWVNEQGEIWTVGWYPSYGMDALQFVAGGKERQFSQKELPQFRQPQRQRPPAPYPAGAVKWRIGKPENGQA